MKRTVRNKIAATLLSVSVVGALGMIGWHASAQQREVFPPVFLPLGMSMNRLMVAVVDDAAHGIWAGGNKDMPLSGEWVEIEMNKDAQTVGWPGYPFPFFCRSVLLFGLSRSSVPALRRHRARRTAKVKDGRLAARRVHPCACALGRNIGGPRPTSRARVMRFGGLPGDADHRRPRGTMLSDASRWPAPRPVSAPWSLWCSASLKRPMSFASSLSEAAMCSIISTAAATRRPSMTKARR